MSKPLIALLTLSALGVFGVGCSSKPPQPVAETPKAAEPVVTEAPDEPTHAIVGEVTEVDPAGAHVKVRTSDGKEHHVEIGPKTKLRTIEHGVEQVAHGTEEVAKATARDVKKGTMVAVRFTEKEGKLVAHEVHHASKEVVKKSEVVIHKIDEDGRKIIVKTKDGAEKVYEVSKDATIATGHKLTDVGKATGEKIVVGTKATIHFTEKAGKSIAHFVHH
ncbi:MAG: hypothetical protein IPP47_25460 [Bryobacterales bacterium]|nr:hypothetical protein [Bryobacterales bacterium]